MEASLRTIKLLSAFSHNVTKNNHKILFPYDPFRKYSVNIKKLDESSKTYKQIYEIESGWKRQRCRENEKNDLNTFPAKPAHFNVYEGLTVTKPSFLEKFYGGRDALEISETGEFLITIKDDWIKISKESGQTYGDPLEFNLNSLNHQVEIVVCVNDV